MKNSLWYVYIVRCADQTFYIGVTTNLEKRLQEHNTKSTGAKYTRSRRPVVLVYTEITSSKSLALQREYALKQLNRKQKMHLISCQSSTY